MNESQKLKLVEQFIMSTSIKNVIEEPKYIRTTETGSQISDRNMKVGGITLDILDLIKDIDKENNCSYGNPEYKLGVITWRDSNMYITQCSIDEGFEVATITSIGFIIQEDDNKIVLAGDIIDGEARRVIAIPKENIIN